MGQWELKEYWLAHLCWNVISKYLNIFNNFPGHHWYRGIQPTHSPVQEVRAVQKAILIYCTLQGVSNWMVCACTHTKVILTQISEICTFYLRVSLAQPLTNCIFWTSSNVANLLQPRMDVTSLYSLSCRSGFLATSCSKKVKVLDVYKIWRKVSLITQQFMYLCTRS